MTVVFGVQTLLIIGKILTLLKINYCSCELPISVVFYGCLMPQNEESNEVNNLAAKLIRDENFQTKI